MQKYALRVAKIVAETDQAKSIYFEIPEAAQEAFAYEAGQYITIIRELNGKEYRRPYSLCTPPGTKQPGVTVKKVRGGNVSVYLNDHVKEGDILEVLSPMGHFTVKPEHQQIRHHYFIAAGSGVTPIYAMIQTLLEEEPGSICHLLYGNTDETSVIFNEDLKKLANKYAGQLFIEHVFSKPAMKRRPGLAGLFSKKETEWKGYTGRISPAILEEYLKDMPREKQSVHFYICGPGDMIEKTADFLESINVPKKHIHKEYFTTPDTEDKKGTISEAVSLKVTLKGETFETTLPPGKTILDVLVDMKKDPPYSCTSGACSTCIAKVTEGKVVMDSCYALEDDEVEAGYILTCQSKPDSNKITITYDV
jgi:ring-1,2-phenylacetyl-CoA epoxidase subunit PaaE